MATITRHPNEPFTDGETASTTQVALEADFVTLYADFNGNMTNANFKASANIPGSKFKDGTIDEDRVTASTITLDSIVVGAVPKHYFTTGSGTLVKAQLTLADIPGITAAVLTPGSTNDMIFMDVSVTYSASANPMDADTITIGWHVDGTETDNVMVIGVDAANEQPFSSSFSVQAPSATSMTIKPMYKHLEQKTVTVDVEFRCFILPGKA